MARSYSSGAGGLRLTRCVGEEIIINEGEHETVIVIEAAAGGRAELRIIAGPNIKIQRAELRWTTDNGGNR